MSRFASVVGLALAALCALPLGAAAQNAGERTAGAPLKGVDVKLGKAAEARAAGQPPKADAPAKAAADGKPGTAPQPAQAGIVKSKSNITNN
ncbi:MAG: hypothetical protein ACN6O3_16285 [Comamonas sp.]